MTRRTEESNFREAYLDTSAFIAFLINRTATTWRLSGCSRLLLLAFVEALPTLTVQGFDANELSKVRRTLARFGDQILTLADAHGLVIMKDRRSAVCWSTDRHPGLTGVAIAVH